MRLLALTLLLSGCAGLQVVPLPPQAEVHRAKTDDGWEISLVRYKPTGPVKGRPVVLCHGIAANERNMDLDDTMSMARWFADQGREAWTMSLRGTGKSDFPDEAKHRGPIFFDDYWRHDLPAVVKTVREISGADAIDYAGHSMGGMVVYVYLAEGGQGIHAAATLGSPTRLNWGADVDGLMETFGPLFAVEGSMFPTDFGAAIAAPFQGAVDDGPFQRMFYAPGNTELPVWKHLMVYGTAPMAGGVLLQLLPVVRDGQLKSRDRTIDFRADLAKVTTPVIVVSARMDRIAAGPAVRDGYLHLGGPKEWLSITRANGAHAEYGHMDLVIGQYAHLDVWPRLIAFFDR